MSDMVGIVFLGIGVTFNFIGTLGLVRMPDLFCRLQVATKCVTFGTGSILLGAWMMTGFSPTGMKALICLIFLFFNAPTGSHALARAYYLRGVTPGKLLVRDELKDAMREKR